MAFKLALTTFTSGLEAQSAQLLGTYQIFDTIAPPVTEAAMRSQLETGQFQAFSNDGWNNLMGQMSALPLDESALTAAQRSIVNTIRAVVAPPAQLQCCDSTTPSMGDGLTSALGYARTGSATWEHEVEVRLASSLTCDIKSVEVGLTPIGLAPLVTSANPVITTFADCTSGGGSNFSKVWTTFATDPTGESYTIVYTFKDSNALTLATYTAAYTLNL
jgi:hypothetical protein